MSVAVKKSRLDVKQDIGQLKPKNTGYQHRRIRPIDKICLLALIIVSLLLGISIIKKQSEISMLNLSVNDIEQSIQQQETINYSLQLNVDYLIRPERIIMIAKESGLEMDSSRGMK